MPVLDLDPSELNPLSLLLTARLADILTGQGYAEAQDQSRGWRRYQFLRFACGSPAWCRLLRLQLIVGGEVRYTITPAGPSDTISLEGMVLPGDPVVLRLMRDPETDPAALPNPFPDADVRLEVHG